jgi:anti-sigma regulatory factor (Ser/Thr protein kinase)
VLELEFGAATLHALREAVLAYAIAAGMTGDRALDVMLALHELAANTVRHGAGSGRLRVQAAARMLHCQVSDVGPASRDSRHRDGTGGVSGPWPVEEGHGLWLARQAADQLRVTAGPAGSQVTVMFALPPPRVDAGRQEKPGDGLPRAARDASPSVLSRPSSATAGFWRPAHHRWPERRGNARSRRTFSRLQTPGNTGQYTLYGHIRSFII